MFIERENELSALNGDYLLPQSSFNIIFGRKGIGKTSLLNQYSINKKVFFISFIETTPYLLYKNLKEQFEYFTLKKIDAFDNFQDFLNLFLKIETKEKLVIIFDDFHNLLKIEKDALNIFFKFWNKSLSNKNIQIIFSSAVNSSSDDEQYIYKKSSNIITLGSLRFNSLKEFLPKLDKKDMIFVYSAFGSNPKYLKYYDTNKDFILNIKETFLKYDTFLFHEGMNIIKKDLTDVGTYGAILHAISMGNKKIGEIASFLNLKSTYLTRYMQKLLDLMIIRKDIPINENIKKSKFGRYEIEENYLRFWFRYVYPNISFLTKGDTYKIVNNIRNSFSEDIVSQAYKEHILHMINHDPYKFLGFIPKNIGSWWNNKDLSIDIVAYDSKDIIFCDCKWKNSESIELNYAKLKSKSSEFKTPLNKKYIIFSKNSVSS